jgi:hypothetical protein
MPDRLTKINRVFAFEGVEVASRSTSRLCPNGRIPDSTPWRVATDS